MTTSETIMSTPNEWMQYQTSYISDISQILPQPTAADASFANSRNINLTPNYGRISKPLRRRSRASRRTPTTLFNTDTANFRSMVQRFTGAPSISTFSATPQPSGGGETFALDEATTAINHAPDPAAGFHMQYAYPLGQQQQVFTINRMQEGGGGKPISSHAPPGFSGSTDHRNYDYYMM